MDERQIRLLVRQAIARHLGSPGPGSPTPTPAAPAAAPAATALDVPIVVSAHAPADPSIAAHRFVIVRPPEETDCIIEPSVTCNHCGYCLCYGH